SAPRISAETSSPALNRLFPADSAPPGKCLPVTWAILSFVAVIPARPLSAGSSSGTLALDNIAVYGTLNAVPEPATIGLLLAGLPMMLVRRRRA
ncbi:MAG: PEP-CTERM sorting domain-containing protein, partial [Phycisphaera sp.]|nr:PEP-CTERM sorting domain-containing protein [Phycisphaera sp.]